MDPLPWQMSPWQWFVTMLMRDGLCQDAAVFSVSHRRFLAAHPGGLLERLSTHEISVLLGENRGTILTEGVTIGGEKCLVIRDNLYQDDFHTMDLRTKKQEEGRPTFSVTIAKAKQVCLILIGNQGGTLNMKGFQMARCAHHIEYQ